ncbi:uncharacterized protein BO95DRAFT_11139 [Aspergillus brunneoviolaceus CBS 621.78]|uniref:Uncharacterized protein n=1 Tax=Aspergillus brunneoviolaceus CBS 621.78 TaxID=1450534 RepID=A0ACD1GIY8_9EURO|nr:hypothetical protein BO95DRAFT_11139 [Aspergillus brunneoviolaceus CBS 621.78]RAH49205.1 hypothetical protein BO95DRAFT_11139 [Aspergillus brunneoviolaceus CBS 621.78]
MTGPRLGWAGFGWVWLGLAGFKVPFPHSMQWASLVTVSFPPFPFSSTITPLSLPPSPLVAVNRAYYNNIHIRFCFPSPPPSLSSPDFSRHSSLVTVVVLLAYQPHTSPREINLLCPLTLPVILFLEHAIRGSFLPHHCRFRKASLPSVPAIIDWPQISCVRTLSTSS